MLPALNYISLCSLFPISATSFFMFFSFYSCDVTFFLHSPCIRLCFFPPAIPASCISHVPFPVTVSLFVTRFFSYIPLWVSVPEYPPWSLFFLICPCVPCPSLYQCYPHFGLYCLDQSCSPCHQTSTYIHFVNLCFLVLPGWYMSLSLNRLYNSAIYTSLCTSSTFHFHFLFITSSLLTEQTYFPVTRTLKHHLPNSLPLASSCLLLPPDLISS